MTCSYLLEARVLSCILLVVVATAHAAPRERRCHGDDADDASDDIALLQIARGSWGKLGESEQASNSQSQNEMSVAESYQQAQVDASDKRIAAQLQLDVAADTGLTPSPPMAVAWVGCPCVFPFLYAGTSFNGCTSASWSNLWCGTTRNVMAQSSAGWVLCPTQCPQDGQSASAVLPARPMVGGWLPPPAPPKDVMIQALPPPPPLGQADNVGPAMVSPAPPPIVLNVNLQVPDDVNSKSSLGAANGQLPGSMGKCPCEMPNTIPGTTDVGTIKKALRQWRQCQMLCSQKDWPKKGNPDHPWWWTMMRSFWDRFLAKGERAKIARERYFPWKAIKKAKRVMHHGMMTYAHWVATMLFGPAHD
eukprot:gnl/TRDRNA2_/TRDRNA2_66733_c0_seq1.p1 gnl/TRDRNA2_/TRDRNA2_66733_c0~~gnl/TRDRNA2_/TRDRNA2_66733_c0_seq1.p1  ORF type:complete len:362 (+),score=47.09 gnl/TRDRNA2_/TRDRNA2_66733_c0_seq1:88-1173(+)